jgi:hypothetical protein
MSDYAASKCSRRRPSALFAAIPFLGGARAFPSPRLARYAEQSLCTGLLSCTRGRGPVGTAAVNSERCLA